MNGLIPDDALIAYADHIRRDYGADADKSRFTVSFEGGQKYIRVVQGTYGSRSSHSFIVAVDDDPKFPLGTILKSASWKTPAKNFARGNVLTGDFKNVRWTGA